MGFMMKIGIVGGTFNPIHLGHLILGEEVRQNLLLDKIIFIPTNLPPHKENHSVLHPLHRLKMVKLAVKPNPYFSVSDIEIKRQGLSYTIETVRELKKLYSQSTLHFITGSDVLKYLDQWRDVGEILRYVTFVVARRPGYPLENLPDFVKTVSIPCVDISAFEIRFRIKEGKSIRYLVPDSVLRYIQKNKLYR